MNVDDHYLLNSPPFYARDTFVSQYCPACAMSGDASSQMLDDAGPSYLSRRLDDARSCNSQYREKASHLTKKLRKLDRTWGPVIAELDRLYDEMMCRNDALQNRSREIDQTQSPRPRDSAPESEPAQFPRMDPAPLIELGVLRPGEDIAALGTRIIELIAQHQSLKAAQQIALRGRDAARRRLVALREMRRWMGIEQRRNREAIEHELEQARRTGDVGNDCFDGIWLADS
jgi:hypothetical protein